MQTTTSPKAGERTQQFTPEQRASRARFELIGKIVHRALAIEPGLGAAIGLNMDIDAADRDCPLDLEKLLAFPLFDFMHDVAGIRHNLNRDTLKLENCFLPRCASH